VRSDNEERKLSECFYPFNHWLFYYCDFNVLIKYADIAMYYAKKSGKNSYCIYSAELYHAEMEGHMAKPGERRQFRG